MNTEAMTDDAAFSPSEQAYFDSRGEIAYDKAADTAKVEPAKAVADATPPDHIDGEVNIDESGTARDKRSGRYVPHGAFHRERTQRQQLETEVLTFREERARLNERLAMLAKPDAQPQAAPEPEADIDPEKDIFGFAKQQAKRVSELQAELRKASESTQASAAAQAKQAQFSADMEAYSAKQPAFGAALKHLAEAVHADMEALGVTDKDARTKQINEDLRNLIDNAFASKRSPSELIYTLATRRGFSPQPANSAEGESQKSQPAQATDAERKIDTIAKGQATAQTLSTSGGGGNGAMTVDKLLSMSESDFAEWERKTPRSVREKILGG